MIKRRVVITGLGAVSALGVGVEPLWEAALEGRSGIGPIRSAPEGAYPVSTAAEVEDFDASKFVPHRKALKVMARDIQLAVAAAKLAFDDAGLSPSGAVNPERMGIDIGAGLLNNELDELAASVRYGLDEKGTFQMSRFGTDGLSALFPLWLLKYLPNMPACHISIFYNLQGPSNTITTACASGAQAIGESARIIERGDADVMVAGGAESKINAFGIIRYQLLGVLASSQNGAAAESYRPFDRRHGGFVIGEGAALLILEEWEHAKARRAPRIYAEVAGYASSQDFNYDPVRSSDLTGRLVAMNAALKDAGLSVREIDHVHAHGSGITNDDRLEAQAIHEVFRQNPSVPVIATKPLTGHTGFASGAFQAVLAALSLSKGMAPFTLNFKEADPACPISVWAGKPKPVEAGAILSNSFGLAGQNASLVFRRFQS